MHVELLIGGATTTHILQNEQGSGSYTKSDRDSSGAQLLPNMSLGFSSWPWSYATLLLMRLVRLPHCAQRPPSVSTVPIFAIPMLHKCIGLGAT